MTSPLSDSIPARRRCLPVAIRYGATFSLIAILSIPPARAADFVVPPELQKRIDAALEKGIAALRQVSPPPGSGQGSIIGYSLLKAHVPADAPSIQRHRAALIEKMRAGTYRNMLHPQHHVYEAGCDAMFLEALDPVAHQAELTTIRDYIVANQRPTGAWTYPHELFDPAGDTSITQYGILGLWAIQRANIQVPLAVWSNAVKFHAATQQDDGGFAYHPYPVAESPARPDSTASMSAAGMGSTLVARLMIYGSQANGVDEPPRRKFGVLERRAEANLDTVPAGSNVKNAPLVSRGTIAKILTSAERAVGQKFEAGLKSQYPIYFLYGCERAAAISGKAKLGGVNWYEQGSEYLLTTQMPDGHWRASGNFAEGVDTAFAILFLTKATQSIVPQSPARPVGGGLLVGGRGLPADLTHIRIQNGVVEKSLPKNEFDQLLKELEQPQTANLEILQQNAVEMVDLDRPEMLIGQMERLQRLLFHPQPEVRQVATWAIGRSNDIRQVPRLIRQLSDADVIVAWEASLSLCYLTRLPMGIQPNPKAELLPVDPPGILESGFNADDAQTKAALQTWRSRQIIAWDAWYQQNRPYDERDDQRQIQSR